MSTRRVLIVDDNEDVTEMLSLMVAMDGHDVRTANAGRDALSVATSFTPDFVLLDIGMPDIDGFEVCTRLRATASGSHALIVALTGSANPDLRERTLASGFDDFHRKPISLAQMRQLLLRQRQQA